MQSTATGSNYYLMKVEILSDYVQVGLCLFKKECYFYSLARYVKSLIKTLKLHICVIEPSQAEYIINHHK